MSMRLATAISKGEVIVWNRTNSEVAVVMPKLGDKPVIVVVPPNQKRDLTARFDLNSIKKSPNLKKLIGQNFLDVVL